MKDTKIRSTKHLINKIDRCHEYLNELIEMTNCPLPDADISRLYDFVGQIELPSWHPEIIDIDNALPYELFVYETIFSMLTNYMYSKYIEHIDTFSVVDDKLITNYLIANIQHMLVDGSMSYVDDGVGSTTVKALGLEVDYLTINIGNQVCSKYPESEAAKAYMKYIDRNKVTYMNNMFPVMFTQEGVKSFKEQMAILVNVLNNFEQLEGVFSNLADRKSDPLWKWIYGIFSAHFKEYGESDIERITVLGCEPVPNMDIKYNLATICYKTMTLFKHEPSKGNQQL